MQIGEKFEIRKFFLQDLTFYQLTTIASALESYQTSVPTNQEMRDLCTGIFQYIDLIRGLDTKSTEVKL
jgi:hypothetical protein